MCLAVEAEKEDAHEVVGECEDVVDVVDMASLQVPDGVDWGSVGPDTVATTSGDLRLGVQGKPGVGDINKDVAGGGHETPVRQPDGSPSREPPHPFYLVDVNDRRIMDPRSNTQCTTADLSVEAKAGYEQHQPP